MADTNRPHNETQDGNDSASRLPIDLWLEGVEATVPSFDLNLVKRLLEPKNRENVKFVYDKNSLNKIFRY